MKLKLESPLAHWVSQNCHVSGSRDDLLQFAQDADVRRLDYHCCIGPGCTTTGNAYWLQMYGGEFFAFCMTKEQVVSDGLRDLEIRKAHDGSGMLPGPTPPLLVDGLKIENSQNLDFSKPIRGQYRFGASKMVNLEGLCMRLYVSLRRHNEPKKPDQTWIVHTPPVLQRGKYMPFEFPPITTSCDHDYVHGQVAPVFIRFCSPFNPAAGALAKKMFGPVDGNLDLDSGQFPMSLSLAVIVRFA